MQRNSVEFHKGSCIRNSVYLQMSPVLNCKKHNNILKNQPPEVKMMWNFVTPKVAEFRKI
jgi:hypothetical protein